MKETAADVLARAVAELTRGLSLAVEEIRAAQAPPADGDEIIDTVEAARLVGVTPGTVRAWCESRRIEGATKGAGRSARWRFTRRSLLARRLH